MERYSVLCPPIKSAHSEYRDQWIWIMSIQHNSSHSEYRDQWIWIMSKQHNSSQLWKNNFKLVLYIFGNFSLQGKTFLDNLIFLSNGKLKLWNFSMDKMSLTSSFRLRRVTKES